MEVGLRFFGGLMGWDVRRAKRGFMGWRFGVGSVMIFVVVFVVVFAPEWKRGERRKRREGKGRGEKRIGEGRREEEGRQEKKRKEILHVYVRKGVQERLLRNPEKRISPHTIKPLHMSENVRHSVPFRIDTMAYKHFITTTSSTTTTTTSISRFFPFPLPTDELFIHPFG